MTEKTATATATAEVPKEAVGRQVTVCYNRTPGHRTGFELQVSVTGTLEQKPGTDSFRILVTDGTFAYFAQGDVALVVRAPGWTTRDGSAAVVYLKA